MLLNMVDELAAVINLRWARETAADEQGWSYWPCQDWQNCLLVRGN